MKYTVSEAGKRLSRLVKEACAGEEVVISADKELSVRLAPVRHRETGSRAKKDWIPGALKGKISYTSDAFDPLTEQKLSDLGFE
jgi:antitoxin (DNA-binding transcriptional repressor) of toxin-antitoxin stability system